VSDQREDAEQGSGANGAGPAAAKPPEPALAPRRPVDPVAADEPHDVLAAEEFAFPAALPPRAPVNPEDSNPAAPPHDVLSADEFAFPAPGARSGAPDSRGRAAPRRSRSILGAGIAALIAAALLSRARRRGR